MVKKFYRIIALILSTAMLSTGAGISVLADTTEEKVVEVSENTEPEVETKVEAPVDKASDSFYVDEVNDVEFAPGYVPAPYEYDYESVGNGTNDDFLYIQDRKYISPGAMRIPTRNQNPYGTCWSFASIAAAEMCVSDHNTEMPDGRAADSTIDMSELHLAYFAGNGQEVYDPLGGMSGDINGVPAGKNFLNNGGSVDNAAHLLASWIGPADENKYSYSNASAAYSTSSANSFDSLYHLNAYFAANPKTDRNAVKTLIDNYGMVTTSYCALQNGQAIKLGDTNIGFSQVYSSEYNSYYMPIAASSNHAVSIVGWDDDFPKENFAYSTKPEGDGAWLVRNSWKEGVKVDADGNPTDSSGKYNAYFWLSYYDASIADTCYGFKMYPVSAYDHNYQYDGAMTGKICSGPSKYANIFTASSDAEVLEDIFFATHSANMEYTIDIYTNVTKGNPTSGNHVVVGQTGKLSIPGGITTNLRTPVELKKGDTFSVVITIPNDATMDVECSDNNLYATKAYTVPGRSMCSFGNGWKNSTDVFGDVGDFRIKAFTSDIDIPNYVSVIYDANGGTIDSDKLTLEKTYNEGEPYGILPIPKRRGFYFDGWYTRSSGGTLITAETIATSDTTYYAHWIDVGEDLQYELKYSEKQDGGIRIDGYTGKATGKLFIPPSIAGKPVTEIGDGAFNGCSGFNGNLQIPDSVTIIGDRAFSGCYGFTGNLVLPENLTTIGNSAFSGLYRLTGDLNIPHNVSTIGREAFGGCRGFTGKLIIPNGIKTIEGATFTACSGLSGDLIIPNSVTNIGNCAFADCSGFTGDLVIPDSVTRIECAAFCHCSGFTGDLSIPNSVTTIEGGAFEGCSGFTGKLIVPNSIKRIENEVFLNCSGLTGDLIIPNSVTEISSRAFYGCSGFNGNLQIPNSVTIIDNEAFYNCSKLDGDLTIPDSVTYLGEKSFWGCNGFTGHLTISEGLTSIEDYTFSGCSFLTGNLKIPNTVTSIGEGAFSGCSVLSGNLNIPTSVDYIGEGAFSGCRGFSGSLTLPNGLTIIEKSVFRGCSGFTGNLTIPESVTTIKSSAFVGCCGFTGDLSIPNNVTIIENSAFESCSGFNGRLTISNRIKSLGNQVFKGCKGLTGNLTIPNGVTDIGNYTFGGCEGFTGNLIIPDSVTSIGASPFSECRGLKGYLLIGKGIKTIGEGTFSGCVNVKNIYIPSNIASINRLAFNYGPKITFHCIPNSYAYDAIQEYGGTVVAWDGTAPKEDEPAEDDPEEEDKPIDGFRIKYELEGGINDDRNPASYKKSSNAIKLYSATKIGYRFNGWYYYKNSKLTKISQIPKNSAQEYTLYAKWSAPVKYSINYNLNKGSLRGQVCQKNYTVEMDDFDLPIPVRDGYTFDGWYPTKALEGPAITRVDTSEARRVSVYARWIYQVQYDANASDATGSMEGITTAQSGKAVNLDKNQFERVGYSFKEWSATPNGKGKKFKDGQAIKDNPTPKNGTTATLYAVWKGNAYTIVFNPNGGQGRMSNMKNRIYGKTYKLTKNKYKKQGATFAGWTLNPDGTGQIFDDQEVFYNLTAENNAIITLYAQWNED